MTYEMLLLSGGKEDQGSAVEYSRPHQDAESEKTQRKGVEVLMWVKK